MAPPSCHPATPTRARVGTRTVRLVRLTQEGAWFYAAANVVLGVVAGLAAAAFGWWLDASYS